MTQVNLTPNGTDFNGGAITGAASAHAALSDSSDSSYIFFSPAQSARVTLTDLSLPAGAEIYQAAVILRAQTFNTSSTVTATLLADSNKTGSVVMTWVTPTDVTVVTAGPGGLTDAGLDAAKILIANLLPVGTNVVYEARVRVTYLVKPTVTVDAPTGTITNNVITAAWTPTLDPHASAVSPRYEARLFTQAQYSVGGFNPASSPATASVSDYGTEYTFGNVNLVNGNYRVYVRVASQTMPDQWSDWAYSAFTVNAPLPGVPTLAVTPEHVSGRVKIDLDDTSGDVGTNFFTVQKSLDGVNFTDLRTVAGDGLVATSGPLVTVYDFEAPNGVTVTYRARALNTATPSYSAWTSQSTMWQSGDEWFKCLLDPALNLKLSVKSYLGFDEPANQGVFRPLGSEKAIAVSDVPGPESGTIVVFSKTETDRQALKALRRAGSPVLVQVPGHPERVVVFGDRGSVRLVDHARQQWHEETLPWTTVETPTGPLVS